MLAVDKHFYRVINQYMRFVVLHGSCELQICSYVGNQALLLNRTGTCVASFVCSVAPVVGCRLGCGCLTRRKTLLDSFCCTPLAVG